MTTDDSLANRYVLVVDDDVFVRNIVARFLRQAGAADVVEVASGREALNAIRSYEMGFDAIVSDVEMRPTNGLELLKAIRTGDGGLHRNLAVVLLTAHGDADLVGEALALDADAFVLKPIGRDELAERVLRVVERRTKIAPAETYAAVSVRSSTVPDPPSVARPLPPVSPSTKGPVPATIPDGAKLLALNLVPADSILATDVIGSDGQTLMRAQTLLTRNLLTRLADLRGLQSAMSELVVFEPAESAT
jgi:CheY-like chemotaxis protein